MKKKIIAVLILIISVFSQNAYSREISFIYINGSDSNDQKNKNWFKDGVKKFHPVLKETIETDSFANKKFLLNCKDTIKKDPVIFLWGHASHDDLMKLIQKINSVEKTSTKFTKLIRRRFAHWMHDAIWVTKYPNMEPLIEDLHTYVMSEYKNGNQVVLLGYSAGSFISYGYMLRKSRYIVPSEFLSKLDASKEIKEYIAANTKVNNICTDALRISKLAFINSSGDIVLNQEFNQIKEIYPKLNMYGDKYCAPDDAVKGVINFGSPFSLFYSEIADLNKMMTVKSMLLYIYIIESDKFMMTVNWANDPLAFPMGKNITFADVEEVFNTKMEPHLGFVYDKSNISSSSIFLFSHDSYFNNSKRFAKSIVNAYKEGYLSCYK